jgi:hypothetical protein
MRHAFWSPLRPPLTEEGKQARKRPSDALLRLSDEKQSSGNLAAKQSSSPLRDNREYITSRSGSA